jgi:hypothetical protein
MGWFSAGNVLNFESAKFSTELRNQRNNPPMLTLRENLRVPISCKKPLDILTPWQFMFIFVGGDGPSRTQLWNTHGGVSARKMGMEHDGNMFNVNNTDGNFTSLGNVVLDIISFFQEWGHCPKPPVVVTVLEYLHCRHLQPTNCGSNTSSMVHENIESN